MKTYKIGRNPDNDIIYDNLSVSGSHADITVDDNGGIILVDHSTNGTYVNTEILHNSAREITTTDTITFPGENVLDWELIAIPKPEVQPTESSHMEQQLNPAVAPPSAFEDLTCRYKSKQQAEETAYKSEPSFSCEVDNIVELSVSTILSEGFKSGLKNCLSLLAIRILSVLTIWIPYLNIGVIIANCSLAPLWTSKNAVNPFDIFKSMYRKPMGDFSIMTIIMILVYTLLLPFMIIPSIVLMFSWMLAPFMVVYKDMSANEALRCSNSCTYGHKWTIFFAGLLFGLIAFAVIAVLALISYFVVYQNGNDSFFLIFIMSIIQFVALLILQSIQIGVKGAIWRVLSKNL